MTLRTGRSLILASMAVVLAFLASTGYTKYLASKIQIDTIGLHENSVPSAKHLIKARGDLLRMTLAVEHTEAQRDDRLLEVQRERRALAASLAEYVSEPFYGGEAQVYAEATSALDKFDTLLAHITVRGPPSPAERRALLDDIAQIDAALGRLVTFNIDHANRHAYNIERVWRRSLDIELLLDVLCVLLAITATAMAVRAIRRYTNYLEERGRELESFSAKMAHDVLSPLSTVGLVVPLLEQRALDSAQAQKLASRAQASLQRVRTLVDDLLAFARAGAQPAPGARAEVREVIDGVVSELGNQAAEADIALTAEAAPSCSAACSPGVLTSMLSNLIRNAIKFMGDKTDRRITVRTFCDGARVRCEVEDTGPGLPPGSEEQVFEPYFRGPNASQTGIGLGLSIVKRLAEAHGGRVGVRSPASPKSGTGALFWFELPAVAARPEAPRPPAA